MRSERKRRFVELEAIACFHCHTIKNYHRNHLMTEAKNFRCRKRLLNGELIQVSVLCSTPFLTYLPKRSTQINSAQYGDPMLMSLGGAPTWRPEVNENVH